MSVVTRCQRGGDNETSDSGTSRHLDARGAYKYLSATGASPLLIEFDQGTLAEVGASWLFTRYLVDQFGDSLPRKLDQTALVGSANVAAQTGQSFTTTLNHWALANWVSDLPASSPRPSSAIRRGISPPEPSPRCTSRTRAGFHSPTRSFRP